MEAADQQTPAADQQTKYKLPINKRGYRPDQQMQATD
jgi:hypothetical protein